ncbi:MAG: 3-deoxy-7-phosphoheptulonate synthase, partial [Candidatus Regiella insecticola]|nr:3-deoxy-7-phosphoheptulonate synthase [Candidatus Regiella insecticola]
MAIYQTSGNQSGHNILRGVHKPNYHPTYISAACQKLPKCQLSPYLMVDVSHGNCENDYYNQLKVAKNIGHQIRSCHSGRSAIVGVMVESFIKEGAQEITDGKTLTYGKS